VAEKNHERLLSIFAEINRQEPSSRLILVGAGTDDAAGISRRVIDRLRLTAAVKALGARGDVPQLLRAADVLLLPSLREGLPAIVLEACVSGVPVLATDLPGVREIARRLVLVRYLPLSAADADWAAAALRLPDEASRLRLRATAAETFRASVFHIDRAVDAYRLLWNGAKHQRADACS
jgi:glycosyltransferase involved in cell wall biosynthesis